jgi:hypothetical protein
LQFQQQQQRASQPLGMGNENGEVVRGFRGRGRGGLVTPPSPRSLSADSNRPRQRMKTSSSSRARGRSSSTGGEVIDDGVALSESSTTSLSTHPSDDPMCLLFRTTLARLKQMPTGTISARIRRTRIPARRTRAAYTSSRRPNRVSIGRRLLFAGLD